LAGFEYQTVRLFFFSFEDWNFNLDTKLTIQVGDESRSSLRAAVNIQQSMNSQEQKILGCGKTWLHVAPKLQ
jgi:hypothetical protein